MRLLGKFALILGTSALMALPAIAQGPRDHHDGPEPAMLLRSKAVREELKLSDEQESKLKAAHEAYRDKHHDEFEKARELKGDERREKMEALGKAFDEESRKTLHEVLTEDQRHRLHQIHMQASLPHSLTHERAAKHLKLTDEQVTKIKAIDDDLHKSVHAAFEEASKEKDRREGFQKAMTLRKEAAAKATALLTDEQKSTWAQMTGAPFEFKPDFDRPGGREGRGEAK